MNAKALEAKLHLEIPLSKFMQVQVVRADDVEVVLESILEPNHNHLNTAFGGSLSSLMLLAGYCQAFGLIQDQGHIVVKSTELKFIIPVQETLRAVCKSPSAKEIESFRESYRRKNRARINLESQIILEDGRIACTLTGQFVAITN